MTNDRLDPGAVHAEGAYLRQRKQELLQEFNNALGTNYSTADEAVQHTDGDASALRDKYVRELRDRGNPSLAERWLAADIAWDTSQRDFGALNEQQQRGLRSVSVEEWTRARDAMNDALEVLERLIAETREWLGEHGARPIE